MIIPNTVSKYTYLDSIFSEKKNGAIAPFS